MPSDLSIRPALPGERAALEALQRRASLANPNDRSALIAHPDAIDLPLTHLNAGHVFAADRTGVLVGFAAVLPREDEGAELDALFVEPDLWKHGIGRALVDYCVAVARSRGATFLHVIGNPHAEGFYLACGFQASGTIDTRFGLGLSMRRWLDR